MRLAVTAESRDGLDEVSIRYRPDYHALRTPARGVQDEELEFGRVMPAGNFVKAFRSRS